MSYDASPVVGDTIIGLREEGGEVHLILCLRKGLDNQGEAILDLEGIARELSPDGHIDPGLPSRAFSYVETSRPEAFADFSRRLAELVERAESAIPKAYASLDETIGQDLADRSMIVVERSAAAVAAELKDDFDRLSLARRQSVIDHLEASARALATSASPPTFH